MGGRGWEGEDGGWWMGEGGWGMVDGGGWMGEKFFLLCKMGVLNEKVCKYTLYLLFRTDNDILY
jgi:hypothetical protein